MRLIKFAGSLVEVQRQAFVCGSHRVVGFELLLCVHPCGNPSPAGVLWGTLFTHSTVWKSVRLQIRCSETNVITLTSTCRFLPSISSHPELVCSAGGREGPHWLVPLCPSCLPARFEGCSVFSVMKILNSVLKPPVPTRFRADSFVLFSVASQEYKFQTGS